MITEQKIPYLQMHKEDDDMSAYDRELLEAVRTELSLTDKEYEFLFHELEDEERR